MANKKKLLIVGSSQGHYGGIEAFMIAMANESQNWEEFDVRLCFKIVEGAQLHDGLVSAAKKMCDQVYFVKRNSPELRTQIAWADILHVQNTPPDIIFPAKLQGKKLYLTVHNWRRTNLSVHNILWGVAIKLADRVWYNSKFVWDTWEPGKKSGRSACVPTVCNLPKFTNTVPAADRKGFIFIGRWIANKGLEELLAAYAICKVDAQEWPLVILGDGPLKQKVSDLINELQLKYVTMPGFVSDEEKFNYLSKAKWLVAPAKTKEDMGLTPIEARHLGIPAIVTRDGGLPESGGPTALVAEPGDVNDLADKLSTAINMADSEYASRADESQKSLETYLKPMSFYRAIFNEEK